MSPASIAAINRLPLDEKRSLYRRIIPPDLLKRFSIPPSLQDEQGRLLLNVRSVAGATDVTLELWHSAAAEDPLLFAHLADTIHGRVHVLLYILNDPDSPRFDVDQMPDGSPTRFGMKVRNRKAEQDALEAGLAPGQIRMGLRMLRPSIQAFEDFVELLGHERYFVDPLYYHNAVIFERHGFAYQRGRRRMEAFHHAFSPGGKLHARLDGSSPFRQPWMADSIRGRSWALHDGISGVPFSDVTMYKRLNDHANVDTFPGARW